MWETVSNFGVFLENLLNIPVFPWGQGGWHVCWRLLFLLYNIFITDRTEAVCTIVWIETAPIAAQYRMLFHVVWFLIHFVLWFFSFLVFFPVSKSLRWLFLLISRHFLEMKINSDISFFDICLVHTSNIFLIYLGGRHVKKETWTWIYESWSFLTKNCSLFWSAQNKFLFGTIKILYKKGTTLQKNQDWEFHLILFSIWGFQGENL